MRNFIKNILMWKMVLKRLACSIFLSVKNNIQSRERVNDVFSLSQMYINLGNIQGRRDKPNKASDFRTSSNVIAKFGKRCRNQSNIWYCNSQKKRHNKQQKRWGFSVFEHQFTKDEELKKGKAYEQNMKRK